jgi:glycerol-3-phosphate dehydrogenase (NAD(P)+)
MRMVAEGVRTTYAAVALADRHAVEMPITRKVEAILTGRQGPREAIRELMERSLKGE